MKRLLSLSDDAYSLKKFGAQAAAIEQFLTENSLTGLELMRWEKPQDDAIPMRRVMGRHMPFWPIFLDFWREDHDALIRQFESEENCRDYYYAESKEDFLAQRRLEFADAAKMGVDYVVVHVSHSELEHCYSGEFAYWDEQIIDAYIELINLSLRGICAQFTVLFENHWLPGLTFLDGTLAMKLLNGVHYPRKGFVLDISHLMNTNPHLEDEEEAVSYILQTLEALGKATQHIKTIHLNSSITGTRTIKGQYDPHADFITRLISAMRDVGGCDPHTPFLYPEICRVIKTVAPEYLVYELGAQTLDELRHAVRSQNAVLSGYDATVMTDNPSLSF